MGPDDRSRLMKDLEGVVGGMGAPPCLGNRERGGARFPHA